MNKILYILACTAKPMAFKDWNSKRIHIFNGNIKYFHSLIQY